MKNKSDYEFPWDHSSSKEDKAVKGTFLFCFVDNGGKRNTDLFLFQLALLDVTIF